MRLFLLIIGICFSGNLLSQSNIVYWVNHLESLPNERIIYIRESPDNDLFLLGRATDENFEKTVPVLSGMKTDGEITFSTKIVGDNVFDLRTLLYCPPSDMAKKPHIKIVGSAIGNNMFMPYNQDVTLEGKVNTSMTTVSFQSIFSGDAIPWNNNAALFVQSILTSDNVYNLRLLWLDLKTSDQIKYKKITSETTVENTRTVMLIDSSLILLNKVYNSENVVHPLIQHVDINGEVEWNREYPSEIGFASQDIMVDMEGNLICCFSYADDSKMIGFTNVYKMDAKGEIIEQSVCDSMMANGILELSDGKIVLYGSVYELGEMALVKRACIKKLENNLKDIENKALNSYNRPDSELPSLAVARQPTSSDFLCGTVLKSGQIVCGGRVYMPDNYATATEMIISHRHNWNIVVFF